MTMSKKRDTYTYGFKAGNKFVRSGITKDSGRWEQERNKDGQTAI